MANSSAARTSCGSWIPLGSGGRRSSRPPMPNSSAASTSCGSSIPLGSSGTARFCSSMTSSCHSGQALRFEPMDQAARTELEAAAFRRLVKHLRERTDVQNIDLMELAGFCRNCLSRWYREEAEERGVELADPQAREIVYGMPYDEWKSRYQT